MILTVIFCILGGILGKNSSAVRGFKWLRTAAGFWLFVVYPPVGQAACAAALLLSPQLVRFSICSGGKFVLSFLLGGV